MLPRVLVALGGGVALALSFEPLRLVVLLPLGIVALLWCVRGQALRRAALLGLLFGGAYMYVLIFWMRVVGWDAWLALASFQAFYYAALGAGLAALSRVRWWPLWSGLLWVGVEVVRGSFPMSGFTWGRVAFATIDTPAADWMPWVGANGTGLVVVWSSALLLWLALAGRGHPRRSTAVLAVGVVVLLVPTAWQPDLGSDGTARVAVVQGDVPGNGDNLLAHHREVTHSHVTLTEQLAADAAAGLQERPDFVVWPENSTAVDPFDDLETREGIQAAVSAIDVPILVGAMSTAPDDDQVLNQGIVVDPRWGAGDRYTKRHPVPFGEYIPFRDTIFTRNFGRLRMIPRDMVAGTRKTPLTIADIEVADAICFDVAYDDEIADQVRRGGQLVVVQTSNAMFIHTGQIEQQFAISRLRALETGRYVVVAAVNGRSGVISPSGEVVAELPPRSRSVLVTEVGLTSGVTPGVVLGPWLGRVSLITSAAALVWLALPYRWRRAGRLGPGFDRRERV